MSETLIDSLRRRAEQSYDATAFIWLEDGEREAGSRTYGELDARARAIAAHLQSSVAPGDRVLLVYSQALPFVDAFFGCLYAGAVPVPTAPDYVRPVAASERLEPIARDAEPRVLLAEKAYSGVIAQASARAAWLRTIPVLQTTAVGPSRETAWRQPAIDTDSLAFLQYTSGSTGSPKGVMVSHANLTANLEMLRLNLAVSDESVLVSWLPLFHDMGLVVGALETVYAGARCVLMSPVAFAQSPRRWLQAITRYHGTIAGGPNFAYELCVSRIRESARAQLDLRSWQRAFTGAEPVRAETLDRFVDAFAPCGLGAAAMDPGYGLAEAVVFVAGLRFGGPRIETVNAKALQEGDVYFEPPDSPGAKRLVSVGPPAPGVTVRIVDPETSLAYGEDCIGEVWVAGPNVALGYWRRPEETEQAFGGEIVGEGGTRYLRTGDLGFLHDGELFITGRMKDLIIVRGQNHYPQDIELTAERSYVGIRPGSSAAFSVEVDGDERLVLVQEIHPRYAGAEAEIRSAVRRAISEEHGLTLHDLVCIPPGRLRKTTSGKIMRLAMRQEYLAGELSPHAANR